MAAVPTFSILHIVYEPRWKYFRPPLWKIFKWAYKIKEATLFKDCMPTSSKEPPKDIAFSATYQDSSMDPNSAIMRAYYSWTKHLEGYE